KTHQQLPAVAKCLQRILFLRRSLAGCLCATAGSGVCRLPVAPAPLWPLRRRGCRPGGEGRQRYHGQGCNRQGETGMLKLRVITALVLVAIVLGALFGLGRDGFAVIAGIFFLAAGWEWSGMMGKLSM